MTTLIGTWLIDETDKAALGAYGDATLHFGHDGALTYTIREGEKLQIIKMTYTVEGDMIVTDQPSAPNVERTEFTLSSDDILTLNFGGMPSRFKRFQ